MKPKEYEIGEIEFLGCKIKVTPDALIPRVETEFLPEHAAPYIESNKTAWDLCTGTGCIGLSIKKMFPTLSVTLSDLSPKCVKLAKENALRNGLDVQIVQGDLFEPFEGQKADYIFCNPPYISKKEFETLDASVKDYEPHMALVGGEDGLEFYRRIAACYQDYLNPNGKLFFEIGTGQGPAIIKIFNGGKIIQDLAGHDRYFILEFSTLSMLSLI